MPVHYLLKSGKEFFVEKEGVVLALSDDLKEVIKNPVFIAHFHDIISYRIMDYYRKRYHMVACQD